MIGSPERTEAAEYYFTYIDKAKTDDIVGHLDTQTAEFLQLLHSITDQQSLHRYLPEKWSIRETLGHINDTERVFAFRAFWVGRGAAGALPGFEQDEFARNSNSDSRTWISLTDEFIVIRAATMSMLRSLQLDSWSRVGTVSNQAVTTRALAFMIAGHLEHHRRIIVERYLVEQ